MWTNSLLKDNAKLALQGKYWRCFLLCFLLGLLGSGASGKGTDFSAGAAGFNAILGGSFLQLRYVLPWLSMFGFFIAAAVLAFNLLVRSPLLVGRNRFFMENRQGIAPLSSVMGIFRPPYWNVVKVQFLVSLKVALGTLLFVVPGIYWSLCYRMVPYLLAENPYLTTDRAMQLSREMMRGEKLDSVLLDLSFFPWYLLCLLTAGIGFLFLEPYRQATYAELYAALRSKAFALGLSDAGELAGFARY